MRARRPGTPCEGEPAVTRLIGRVAACVSPCTRVRGTTHPVARRGISRDGLGEAGVASPRTAKGGTAYGAVLLAGTGRIRGRVPSTGDGAKVTGSEEAPKVDKRFRCGATRVGAGAPRPSAEGRPTGAVSLGAAARGSGRVGTGAARVFVAGTGACSRTGGLGGKGTTPPATRVTASLVSTKSRTGGNTVTSGNPT